MLALLLTAAALAGDGVVLPAGEDPAAWARAFAETSLEAAADGPAWIEARADGWRLVVVDRAGITHIAAISVPLTAEDRLDVAYLVLSLLEPAGEGTWRRALARPASPPTEVSGELPVPAPALATPPRAVAVEERDPDPDPGRDLDPAPEPEVVTSLPARAGAIPDPPESPSTSGPGGWLSVQVGVGAWPGWNDRLQGRVEAGVHLAERWRIGAGALLSGPLVLDELRQGTERGAGLVLAGQLAPLWLHLGASLTDRAFSLRGKVVDRVLVPSVEAGVRLGFEGPLGLSASPLLQLRRDLRSLEVRIGAEPDGALPPWDLQLALVITWSSARDQLRGGGDT